MDCKNLSIEELSKKLKEMEGVAADIYFHGSGHCADLRVSHTEYEIFRTSIPLLRFIGRRRVRFIERLYFSMGAPGALCVAVDGALGAQRSYELVLGSSPCAIFHRAAVLGRLSARELHGLRRVSHAAFHPVASGAGEQDSCGRVHS